MKTVFYDVDTQMDFMLPAGALYVPGAERIVDCIAQLNRHAAAQRIPLISSVDAHLEDEVEFKAWPHHCVTGTLGQRKVEATLVEGRVVIPNQPGEIDVAGARQIILEKQTVNAFDTMTIEPLLRQLNADRFVLYGVVTEVCVLWAARGLQKMGKRVTVVTEAIKELDAGNCRNALDEIRAGGGSVAGLGEILAG